MHKNVDPGRSPMALGARFLRRGPERPRNRQQVSTHGLAWIVVPGDLL